MPSQLLITTRSTLGEQHREVGIAPCKPGPLLFGHRGVGAVLRLILIALGGRSSSSSAVGGGTLELGAALEEKLAQYTERVGWPV